MNFDPKTGRIARKAETVPMKNAVFDLLNAYNLKEKYQEIDLIYCWKKVVGQKIAHLTNLIYKEEKTLFIELESEMIKLELNKASQMLLVKMNEVLEESKVEKIVFL